MERHRPIPSTPSREIRSKNVLLQAIEYPFEGVSIRSPSAFRKCSKSIGMKCLSLLRWHHSFEPTRPQAIFRKLQEVIKGPFRIFTVQEMVVAIVLNSQVLAQGNRISTEYSAGKLWALTASIRSSQADWQSGI